MKLCSRLLMVFGRHFCKNDNFGYLNPILGKLGVMHDLGWTRWKVYGRLYIRLMVIELSSRSSTVPELWGEMYTARGSSHRGIDLFALKFYLDRVVLINSWRLKTRDTGLSGGKTASFYRSVTDRRTDRQTDYTALAELVLQCAVIKIINKVM